MGVFTRTAIYFGRLVSRDAFLRIKDIKTAWYTDLGDLRGRYVIHPPGCFLWFNDIIDPILEPYKICKDRVITWDDVLEVIDKEQIDVLKNEVEGRIMRMENMVFQASCGQDMFCGYFIVQIETDSMCIPVHHRVKYNLPIRDTRKKIMESVQEHEDEEMCARECTCSG